MSFFAKDRSIRGPVAGYHLSSYTTTPCRFEFSHDESFRRLQEALNSSHQLVKLLLDQDLLPPRPFSWPCWGHGSDTRNSIDVPPAFPRAAGTSVRRMVATEWLGRAVIHHLAIFSVDIENVPAVESPKVSYDVVGHDVWDLAVTWSTA